MRITLLRREGCHLCDDAADAIAAVQDDFRLEVTTVDIDADDGLVRDYGLRVLVVLGPDGSLIAEGIVTQPMLIEALAAL